MPAFKDADNREWLVKLDAPTIRDVRDTCKVDLGNPDGKGFEQLDADIVLFVDVLWVICRGQNAGVTDEQFGRALFGDALGKAAEALREAYELFFPPQRRSLLRAVSEKTRAVEEKAAAMALAKINSPELEAEVLKAAGEKMDRELREALTRLNGVTNSPESAESAPAG
jgi:hypothetical protein